MLYEFIYLLAIVDGLHVFLALGLFFIKYSSFALLCILSLDRCFKLSGWPSIMTLQLSHEIHSRSNSNYQIQRDSTPRYALYVCLSTVEVKSFGGVFHFTLFDSDFYVINVVDGFECAFKLIVFFSCSFCLLLVHFEIGLAFSVFFVVCLKSTGIWPHRPQIGFVNKSRRFGQPFLELDGFVGLLNEQKFARRLLTSFCLIGVVLVREFVESLFYLSNICIFIHP